MEVRQARTTDPKGAEALAGWAAYERALYGDHPELYATEPDDFEPPTGAFFVVVTEGSTVAGGGFRRRTPETCEVKRMWTSPQHRRRGFASALLDTIEHEARTLGYSALCLETGPSQHEAIALYRKRYQSIPAYHYDDALAFGISL